VTGRHLKVVFLLVLITMLTLTPGVYPSTASATGAVLIHQFDFNDSLTDSLGTETSLTVHPNTATSGFSDGEWWWTATRSPGGGLILETPQLSNPSSYSLGFRIKYNQVTPGYRKILSFKGPSSDNGLYFHNSYLNFYPFGSNTAITYSANTFYDFIFTRSSDQVIRVYIVEGDGTVTKVYERDDPSNATVPIQVNGKYQFMFFMDDVATSGEWTTGGTVRSIRLWNGAINEEYVGDALSDVTTGTATDITDSSAALQGSVNPYGLETAVYFEYGLTSFYGTEVLADQSPITGSTAVTKAISGLDANTTYHFRVKAVNSAGTIFGADQSFTTTEPLVVPVPVTGVTLNHTELTLSVGDEPVTLVATLEPPEADNKNVIWSSSDESVATVLANSPAIVTPVGEGSATITVTTEDGEYSAQCVVTVLTVTEGNGGEELPVLVTGVVLMPTELTLTAGGDPANLLVTVEPANADNKNVIWSSSDESIATVHANSPAVVTPVSEGTAIITVTTEDGGFSAQCIVTVLPPLEEERELPQTGGSAYYVLGLLALAGGALSIKKRK
jgi:LPXTG-motif cell wall-anchored protein